MSQRQPRYSKEEHSRRGTEIYERQVRPKVDPAEAGKIVAIDIDSGEFAIAETSLAASERLLRERPNAQVWCVRVGENAVHRFGTRVPMRGSA
jgi:hypothetical protein